MLNGNNTLILNLDESEQQIFQECKDTQERMLYIAKHFGDVVSYKELGEYKVTHLNHNIHLKSFLEKNKKYIKYYIYIGVLQEHKSPTTMKTSVQYVGDFLKYCSDNYGSNFLATELKKYMITDYIEMLHSQVKSFILELKTVHEKLRVVLDFYKFMHYEGLMECSFISQFAPQYIFPYSKPEKYFSKEEYLAYLRYEEEKTRDKPYEYKELTKILEGARIYSPYWLYCFFMIAAHTALRLQEMLNLKIGCAEAEYCNDKTVYWLSNYKYLKAKQKTWQDGSPIKINKEVYEIIGQLEERSMEISKELEVPLLKDYLFLIRLANKDKISIVSPTLISQETKLLEKAIGISDISNHRFRHTCAKLWYDKGVPIEFIRKYLNHSTGDMSAEYINHNKKENIQKYKYFIDMENISAGGKEQALRLQERVASVFMNENFQGMAEELQVELLDRIMNAEGIGLQLMDHGICMLPKGTVCPNRYTSVNSCLEEHCDKFVIDNKSILFVENLKRYKENSLENLKKMNFKVAYEQEKERLQKTIAVLEDLKR